MPIYTESIHIYALLVFGDENKLKAFSLKAYPGCHIFVGPEFEQGDFIKEGFVCGDGFFRRYWTQSILRVQQTRVIRLSGSRGVAVCWAAQGPRALGSQWLGSELPALF